MTGKLSQQSPENDSKFIENGVSAVTKREFLVVSGRSLCLDMIGLFEDFG